MQKIIVAKNAGFCMGVKRAVDMVLGLAKKSKGQIYTYGPLIHNPQVIEDLAEKGVHVLSKDTMPKSGTVIIRTHGVTPNTKEKFEKAGLKVFDATCPFVKKVQYIIDEYSKKGHTIVIIGDKGHAEVDSYLGYAKGKGIVVSTLKESGKADKFKKICVVAQTTQDKNVFKKIVNKLRNINPDLKIFSTICNATSNRQEEALSISKKVDAMIVVGGSNSANTLRLFDICKSAGVPTFFIEKADDLNVSQLSGYKIIGVTAGASTPKDTIQEVVREIKRIGHFSSDDIPKGTAFQQKVWRAIKKIPYGETRTYKEIAKTIGSPNAFRAVGQACNKNPLPAANAGDTGLSQSSTELRATSAVLARPDVTSGWASVDPTRWPSSQGRLRNIEDRTLTGPIPCHRVVRSDGKIGGYARGVKIKRALLEKEKCGK